MTQYVLRDYQSDAVSRTVEYLLRQAKLKRGRNGVVYLPTAAGKSLCIGSAAIALAQHGPTIVTQPSKEILEQNLTKIESYGFRCGVMSASMGRKDVADVTLATIGTIYKRPEWFSDFQFGLSDECHLINSKDNSKLVVAAEEGEFFHREFGLVRELPDQEGVAKGKVRVMTEDDGEQVIARPKQGMYKSFIEALPRMVWAGFSASPYRRYSDQWGTQLQMITRTRPAIFSEFIHWTQNKELFDAGHLAKLEYYPVNGFKRSQVAPNSTGADFDEKALQMHLFEKNWETKAGTKVDFKDKLTETVERVLAAGRKRVIVFTSSIAESERLAQELRGDCAVITGESDPDYRRGTLDDFRNGDLPVLANVGVYIHGLDVPEIDCVVDAAPTMSLSRFYQKIGRGVRIHPNKESCWIIDMVEGVRSFGKVEDLTLYCDGQRKWNIYGRPGEGKEVALTHVYLNNGVRGLCPKCRQPKTMAFYPKSGKWLPLSPGRGNVIIELEGTKKICRFVKRGEGEYVFHSIVCNRKMERAA